MSGRIPPVMMTSPNGNNNNNNTNFWAPELDMTALERQVDHYADEAIKAAQKIQVLPNAEGQLLQAAAASNKIGGASISPRRVKSGGTVEENNNTSWRSLPSLPPYILRLLFASGQMYQWLTRSRSTSSSGTSRSPHRQDTESVVGNFSHLVLPIHEELARVDVNYQLSPEKVVQYLTEFSEDFPQISEVELILHQVMSEISTATTPSKSQQRNQTPRHATTTSAINHSSNAKAVLPATEGELMRMTPTQRAQFASDILACHRSPVVYAVRQWCFAIGRYLLLLDQWIRMRRRDVQVLSRERTRKLVESGSPPRSPHEEELEVDDEMAKTQRDMEETFKEKFLSRGGSMILLKSSQNSDSNNNKEREPQQQHQTQQQQSRRSPSQPQQQQNDTTPAAQVRTSPEVASTAQQQISQNQKDAQSATVHDAQVGTNNSRSPSLQQQNTNNNNNNNNTSQQQNFSLLSEIESGKNKNQDDISMINQQQQNMVHSPMSVRQRDSDVVSTNNNNNNNNGESAAEHHSVALSRLHYIQDAEERQRAMALVESYRQELALERSKRQEAENENRVLRLEASKFEAKMTDTALEERKNAQMQISNMKKQLESALADASSASNSKSISEGSRAQLQDQVRELTRHLEVARAETNDKVQQLLVTAQRLESSQVELRDSRKKMENAEQQKKEAQRELEQVKIISQRNGGAGTPSVTPSREHHDSSTSQNIRTIDGSMILAAASGTKSGHSSVLGVHRGYTALHSALIELQSIENSSRLELEVSELDYTVSNVNLMRGDLLSLLIGSERTKKYLTEKVEYGEKQLDQLRESSTKNELLESAQNDITRLRHDNEDLQKRLEENIHESQSRFSQKSSSDEARIRGLETELTSANQKITTMEENASSFRFQAADTEHRLKLKYHEEQELRVKAEVSLRNEVEKATRLASELDQLQKDKLNLAELHREAVAEVTRVSSSADSSSKVLANRVQELEKLCDQQRQELDDTRKQNRAINDEMAAVRRHNATLDNQLASSPAHPSTIASVNANASANNILIDALKTKIETLESRDRENQSNHQSTVSQLEQRLSKLRSELLTATEASEHSMFDLRRNLQTAQLKSETAENQLKDAQKRVADTEREMEYLREQNREISNKLQTNSSARSDNEALKEQLRYIEDDLGRKREEVSVLRGERQHLQNKIQDAQKNLETSKLDHEKLLHDESQRLAENERNIKRRCEESIREAEKKAQEKYDQDLSRVTAQLEVLQRQDRELQSEKITLQGEARKSNERIAQLEQQYSQAQVQIQDLRNMIQLLQTRAEADLEQKKQSQSIERERELEDKIKKQQRELEELEKEKQQQQKQQLEPHPPTSGASPQSSKSAGKIETLESISKRVGVSIEDLMKANPLISSPTAPLARGTRVILPAVNRDGRESATTSTSDLGPNQHQQRVSALNTTSLSPSHQSTANSNLFTWNSLDDLIQTLDINVDIELLKELNEKVVDGTDKPLPPGANVILPISASHRVPSIEHLRSRLNLHADGAVRLRDGPEPRNPDSALPIGSIVNICRSVQNPEGASIFQLAQRLSMPVGSLLEANPSIQDQFETIPWYKTIFVPRREDPADALSVSWRRTRKDKVRREKLLMSQSGKLIKDSAQPTTGMSASVLGSDDFEDNDEVSTRPPWTLEETSRRCGISFDELMRTNASSFPGTCRIAEDLLPHFIPFKFILRPFRREVHPKRIQDVARMLQNKVNVEDLLKANSGVSSGTSLLRPHQTIKIPIEDSNYWRDEETGNPLTVSDVARMLRVSPVEFLKDNHRQFLNMSEHVVSEFFITVRDVDQANFGDFILQLGTIDPIERKKREEPKEEVGKAKFFDRLREAMDYGPRKNEFEDEEELEEEAKRALMKKRRNSNDYWNSRRENPDYDDSGDADLSASQRQAKKQNAWATGWVSRVSVHDQKVADSARRLAELEEQERQSQSRVRHLPLLAAAGASGQSSARRSRSTTPTTGRQMGGGGTPTPSLPHQHQQQQAHHTQHNGIDDVFVSDDEDGDDDQNKNDAVDAAFNNTQTGKAKTKFSRPTSAAFLKLASTSPPPLAQLDNIPGDRPSSAAVLRQQIASARNSSTTKDNTSSLAFVTPTSPESILKTVAPRRPQLPEELRMYLKQDVTPTNKENTMQFFDFNLACVRKYLNDDTFRAIIELVAKKQSQSIVSVYFAGITSVSPEVVLKGVSILSAYCNKFNEFTTEQMQFPPAAMAQLKLLMNRKEELRQTKWIFEGSVASQRSVMHLKGKKLTDASAVLLDALDEMTSRHGINIFDLRDNFLTSGTGKQHLMYILEREWSPVTSILVDDNPEMEEVARLQISEVAEKKEKKQLQRMAFEKKQEQMGRVVDLGGGGMSPARPMSATLFSRGSAIGEQQQQQGGEQPLSPTQKRFMNRFG